MEEPKLLKVVAGLIYRDGRLLICQRSKSGAFPLQWEFPGGKIDNGESAAAALRRELKEELDIEVGEVSEVYRHEHKYADGPQVHLSFFAVYDYTGIPKNLVFEQILWADLSELVNFEFLAGDQPLIHRLASDGGAGMLVNPKDFSRPA